MFSVKFLSETEFAVEGRPVSSYFSFWNKGKKNNKHSVRDFFILTIWKKPEGKNSQYSRKIVLIFLHYFDSFFF